MKCHFCKKKAIYKRRLHVESPYIMDVCKKHKGGKKKDMKIYILIGILIGILFMGVLLVKSTSGAVETRLTALEKPKLNIEKLKITRQMLSYYIREHKHDGMYSKSE